MLFIDNALFAEPNADELFYATPLPVLPNMVRYYHASSDNKLYFTKEQRKKSWKIPSSGLINSSRYHRYFPTKLSLAIDDNPRQSIMSNGEERQRFLEYNYAKKKSDTVRANYIRDYITRKNMPLLYSMVERSYKRYHLDWEDSLSECQSLFINAIDGFNVALNGKFSTYVCHTVINALTALTTKNNNLTDRHKRKSLLTQDQQPADVLEGIIAKEGANVQELNDVLKTNKAHLTIRERVIVIHRFGIGGIEKKSLKELGTMLDLSYEWIRLTEQSALKKLRAVME